MSEKKLYSPAADRNQEPILTVLKPLVKSQHRVVEIAAGSGQHSQKFAKTLRPAFYQPTDASPEAVQSIAAYRSELPNPLIMQAPVVFDVEQSEWVFGEVDLIITINMIHISPWTATERLLVHAERWLKPGGHLYLYGPYFESDVVPAPSNISFDQSLKSRDPSWGIRDLAAVTRLAHRHSLHLERRVDMPANNLSVVFQHR